MSDRLKVRNMEYHKKALNTGELGALGYDRELGKLAVDAMKGDKKHPGLAVGVYCGKEMRALIVFENIESDGKRVLAVKECREAESGICEQVEKDIVKLLSEYVSAYELAGAVFGKNRLVKEKTENKLTWFVPIAMIISFALIYANIFESRVAGMLCGGCIGMSIGSLIYRSLTVKVIARKEENDNAASE